MGDITLFPVSDTERKLRHIKRGLEEGKTAKQIRDEGSDLTGSYEIAIHTALRAATNAIGWKATAGILRQYLQKHGERL